VSGWKDRSKLKPDAKLDNPGTAWSALYQLVNWQLDAVRQTRAWKAWSAGGWQVGHDRNKDTLNGKEEAILAVGSSEKDATELNDAAGIPNLFKAGELLGATTLIKRLWPSAWLQSRDVHSSSNGQPLFKGGDFSMPDTRQIAEGQPFADDSGEDGSEESQKYFAVLVLDGDEIGQWISGLHKKMPKLRGQLSSGALNYFQKHLPGLLDRNRPLSPSFHLQFSEMLANFSNYCVRRIVEAFDGRLIYSGGDDVLALLPAATALACASALREAFRGNPTVLNTLNGAWQQGEKQSLRLFDFDQPGFMRLHSEALCLQGEPKKFHAIVPGPATDCSVGIAIAHFKSPIQDVVRAALEAEKRAKKQLGRSAVAVTLIKRSGETIEWGSQWNSGGLDIFNAVMKAMAHGVVSSKFPHRVIELLDGYLTETSPLAANTLEPLKDFPVVDVVLREFRHALDRQGQIKQSDEYEKLVEFASDEPPEKALLNNYLVRLKQEAEAKLRKARQDSSKWSSLSTQEKRRIEIGPVEAPVRALIGLCQTVAFANLTSGNNSQSAASAVKPHAERQLQP
jgi:hypothetical protein